MLPGKAGDRGNTAKDNRLFVDAVLWIGRTGAPWRDLPEAFGPWNSVYKRFSRGSNAGVWHLCCLKEFRRIATGVRDTGGRVTLSVFNCTKPVIAAINGPAVGIGATMALAMDVRLASDRYGLRWQIVPAVKDAMMPDPDPARSKRVTDAMPKRVAPRRGPGEQAYGG